MFEFQNLKINEWGRLEIEIIDETPHKAITKALEGTLTPRTESIIEDLKRKSTYKTSCMKPLKMHDNEKVEEREPEKGQKRKKKKRCKK